VLGEPTAATAAALGRAAVALHAVLAGDVSPHSRFALNLVHLLDQPLAAVRPFLEHRPEDVGYLEQRADLLRRRITALAPSLDRGPCHGDLHRWNAHVDEDGRIILFDFDRGGPGWRAYDVAVFRWSVELFDPRVDEGPGSGAPSWTATWGGALSEADVAAIPLFVVAREIWFLGLQATLSPFLGSLGLDDRFFDLPLARPRTWESAHLPAEG
jgi:Ser/Thr protein kinase RdoA (MazF antagonist)